MSDIKTALAQATNEWEQGADASPTAAPAPMTGVSQATFDHIKNNPGKSIQAVVRALEAQGYKTTSTTTLISAMVRNGIVQKDRDKRLVAVTETHVPAQTTKKVKERGVKQGIAAVQPQAAPATVEAPPTVKEFDVDALIDSLTLRQAMELRKRLNDMWMGSYA